MIGKILGIVFLLSGLQTHAQTDSAELRLSWFRKRPVAGAQKDSDLVLNITLTSRYSRPIKVQNRQVFYVYKENFPGRDAFIQVMTGKDSTVEMLNASDQLLLNTPPPPVTLAPGQSVTYAFDLINYYMLEPHRTYRVRVGYELSSFNDLPDVYSDWLAFDL